VVPVLTVVDERNFLVFRIHSYLPTLFLPVNWIFETEVQKFRATKPCTVAPNICGSSVWNVLHVSMLVLTILRWLPNSVKICPAVMKVPRTDHFLHVSQSKCCIPHYLCVIRTFFRCLLLYHSVNLLYVWHFLCPRYVRKTRHVRATWNFKHNALGGPNPFD
jgi:hypothetical protein